MRDHLQALHEARDTLALPWPELAALYLFLAEHFEIRSCEDPVAEMEAYYPGSMAKLAALVNTQPNPYEWGAIDEAPPEHELEALSVIQPYLGTTKSIHWPILSDTMAYVIAVARRLNMTGPILDLGCHAGYQSLALAMALQAPVLGVDTNLYALEVARQKALDLGCTQAHFELRYFPDDLEDLPTFQIIVSNQTDLELNATNLEVIAKRLAPDGIFVCAGELPPFEDLVAALSANQLSLALCDVVGGFGPGGYQHTSLAIFCHDLVSLCPENPEAESALVWDRLFVPYANQEGRPDHQKTLAQMRSEQVFGPNPIR